MSETTPTPNAMPTTTAPQEAAAETKPTKTETPSAPADTGASVEERAELDRLRAIHKEEQKWEKRAKQNFDDAARWRQLSEQLGGKEAKEFDPQAAFNELLSRVETSDRERIRVEVARTEEVDPDFVLGDTEEAMRESAQRYKSKIEAAIEKALKGRAPAAVPASEVTSNGKVAGPNQITSRDQLKTMSPPEILAAQKEGRLDSLMGKH